MTPRNPHAPEPIGNILNREYPALAEMVPIDTKRPRRFRLDIVEAPDKLGRDVHRRLAAALKLLGRGFALKCIKAVETTEPQEPQP